MKIFGGQVSAMSRQRSKGESSHSTPRLTGAGARSAQGTNTDLEDGEAMAGVGVRVEPTVMLLPSDVMVEI
ncbi:MAG: hypothetical protein Q8L16_16465 [Hydrogenophaga sp.]|nr:hypothetical protein [Hydrogenophaga sp.]